MISCFDREKIGQHGNSFLLKMIAGKRNSMGLRKRAKEILLKRTEGIISLLLILLLVPFYTVAGVLEEVGRYQSALRGMNSTINASEISILAQYDSYLMNRFGLLAIDQNIDVAKQFSAYLEKQDTQDTRSFFIQQANVNGVYPLADTDVMRQQIEELSSILVPEKVVLDFGDLNNLASQLESYSSTLTSVNKMLGSVEKGVQSGLDSYNAQKDAKEQMDVVVSSTKKYKDEYSNFQNAMNELKAHLESECPADEEGAEKWQNTLDDLKNKAIAARDSYKDTITDESANISKLAQKFDTAVAKEATAKDAAVGIVTTTGSLIESDVTQPVKDKKQNLEEKKKKVDKQKKKDGITENEKNAMSNVSESLGDKINQYDEEINDKDNKTTIANDIVDAAERGDETKEILEDYNSEACKSTLDGLQKEIKELDKINMDNVTTDDIGQLMKKTQITDVSKFEDPQKFNELWNQTRETVENGATNSTWGDIVNSLMAIVNIDASYDPELDSIIDTEYYNKNFGGLPTEKSKKRDQNEYSLISPFEENDAERARKNLLRMKLPLQDDDGHVYFYGENLKSGMETDVGDVNSKNLFEKLKAVIKTIKSRVSSVSNMLSAMSDISKKMQEGALLKGYLAYSLSTRTNYTSESSLVGQSYSGSGGLMKVDDKNGWSEALQATDKLGVTSSFGRKGYSFCGAELEYVMFGNMSEKENQKAAYYRLVLLHFLTSLLVVPRNAFVQTTTQAVSAACIAVPWMVPVAEATLPIVFSYANGVIDAIRICNGDSVKLFKSDDDLNVTPTGLVKAIKTLTDLQVTTEKNANRDIENALDKLRNLTNQPEPKKDSDDGIDQKTNTEESVNTGEKKGVIDGKKYADSVLAFDYDQYMFLMLLLFWNNEDELLNRFADIIQMEQTNRNNTVNNTQYTLGEQITGKHRKFDIDEAYTTLRADVKGKFVNVLPVPTLAKRSGWSMKSVIYQGY